MNPVCDFAPARSAFYRRCPLCESCGHGEAQDFARELLMAHAGDPDAMPRPDAHAAGLLRAAAAASYPPGEWGAALDAACLHLCVYLDYPPNRGADAIVRILPGYRIRVERSQ